MPSELIQLIVMTTGAALCMPLGGLLARIEQIRPQWLENEFRHSVIAFGGGLLLGGVFQVLLPDGLSKMDHPVLAVLVFMLGGVLFFALERTLGLQRRNAPQLTGMLVDFIPETIALGGLAVAEPDTAMVLAIVIGLQNIPEGFNAYRELKDSRQASPSRVLWFMAMLVPLGPLAGLGSYYGLEGHPRILAIIMLLAAGGIVYLMFQDIAPQSRLRQHWAPALGAVVGVSVTLLTQEWIG